MSASGREKQPSGKGGRDVGRRGARLAPGHAPRADTQRVGNGAADSHGVTGCANWLGFTLNKLKVDGYGSGHGIFGLASPTRYGAYARWPSSFGASCATGRLQPWRWRCATAERHAAGRRRESDRFGAQGSALHHCRSIRKVPMPSRFSCGGLSGSKSLSIPMVRQEIARCANCISTFKRRFGDIRLGRTKPSTGSAPHVFAHACRRLRRGRQRLVGARRAPVPHFGELICVARSRC
ncbi:hypothetical protein SAMN05421548_14628 [Paraburkholderia lycopersici]|uniref:Uncharacterized protein n=1 Tax=Paraburkholderia lycopersici TaxID=416944 RepID=A0A1G7CLY7_9BURK|nr:hypothetical protein SAMN05421548_14628 [Paraburkholderia lycopersici]